MSAMERRHTMAWHALLALGVAWAAVAPAGAVEPLLLFDARTAPASVADQYEVPHLLAALSGLANRHAPRFFYLWTPADAQWLDYLQRPGGWLAGRAVTRLASLEEAVAALRDRFFPGGAVLYDPRVAQTAVVASTVAGADDLVPVCYRPDEPTSLYNRLLVANASSSGGGGGAPLLRVNVSLVGRFDGRTSGSAKYDAVDWARRAYLDGGRSNPRVLAYYIDYFWTQASGSGSSWLMNTVGNHDYFIAQRAFFFDLSPWADEAPNDDPAQPLGTDVKALHQIMGSAYAASGGNVTMHVGGFVPWPFKYVQPHGRHEGVATEWEYAQLISAYNGYMDADAAGLAQMANAAFFTHFPLNASYAQNAPPAAAQLEAAGWLSRGGRVVPRHYYMFYAGDYDSAAWLYNMMSGNWDDPARGAVPIGWAVDPNLAARFPVIFAYMLNSLTPNDRLIAGDSGAGYLNPSALLPPRSSGLPSGAAAWEAHCAPLYARFDYNFTGFLINGNLGPESADVERMYTSFSAGGVVSQYGQPHFTAGMPVFVHTSDIPGGDAAAAAAVIAQSTAADTPLAFHVFRSILQPASFHRDVAAKASALDARLALVEPLALAALAVRAADAYTLPRGAALAGGEAVASPNLAATLIMQTDGNLVLYSRSRAVWDAHTAGHAGAAAAVSAAGALVVTAAGGGAVLFATPAGGARLVVQDDCNLVLYAAGGAPVWASGTAGQC